MYNQLERQGKSKQRCPKTTLFFSERKRRAALSRIPTRNVLCSRQTLYQLSLQGSSAGRAESLKFIQGKWRLSPDKQGYFTSALRHTPDLWPRCLATLRLNKFNGAFAIASSMLYCHKLIVVCHPSYWTLGALPTNLPKKVWLHEAGFEQHVPA